MKAAEHQHFTNAAEELNVSQPYLSSCISELEAELGVKLFDRVGRGIRLNDYGRIVYRYAAQIFCSKKDLMNELMEAKMAGRRQLSLATNASMYMPGLLRRVQESIPDASIRLYLIPQDELYRRLTLGEIDFAILGPEVREGFESMVLIADGGIVVWPDGHWLSGYSEIDVDRILGELFIGVRKGYAMAEYLDKYFSNVRVEMKSYLETFDTNSALQFVKTGAGIAMAPASTLIIDPYFRNHYTKLRNVPKGTVHLVWRKGQYLDGIARSFMELSRDFFGKLDEDAQRVLRGEDVDGG